MPETPIQWIPVYGSSNVDAVAYNPEKQECFVRFIKGGDIYAYMGVPEEIFKQLLHASSKGRFVQIYLRRAFASRKES